MGLDELVLLGLDLRVSALHLEYFLGSQLPMKTIRITRNPFEPILESFVAIYRFIP